MALCRLCGAERGSASPRSVWIHRGCYWVVFAFLVIGGSTQETSLPWRIAGVACFFIMASAVLVRRTRPWLFILTGLISLPLIGEGPLYVALWSFASRRRGLRVILVGVTCAVLISLMPSRADHLVTFTLNEGASWLLQHAVALLVSASIVLVIILHGATVSLRRDLMEQLRYRTQEAEAQRELLAREAVLLERARIAREMHDVLGHKLALVTMQAGALEMNPDMGVERVEAHASQLRGTAREALQDLRKVVGALDHAAPLAPQPGIDAIQSLIETYRQAGANVILEDEVTHLPEKLWPDPLVGRTVHRVLVESLTNAHRHAPGMTVRLSLRGTPGDTLVVEACNRTGTTPVTAHEQSSTQGTPCGGGTGLAGLAERVRLAEGRFTAGLTDKRFRLQAEFPWSPSPTSQDMTDERKQTP